MLYMRALLIIVFIFVGYLIGSTFEQAIPGVFVGLIVGGWAIMVEMLVNRSKANSIIGAIMGLALGILAAWLMLIPLKQYIAQHYALSFTIMSSMFGYAGFLAGLQQGRGMSIKAIMRSLRGGEGDTYFKLLDTSVIIDGRIADICETSFIDGIFIAPQFILHELQHIADSADSLKRARGRRGLDILQRMQKMHQITVRIVEDDFPKIKEVDSKLVALGKRMDAKIITNDFNLNKVAELQGVTVLNINELANAIKPLVLPGEPLHVFVVKEGKEQNQGVAYLEDGTMVVVDNGRKQIGKTISVTVTSVLQTTAGRMIFTKTKEDYDRDEGRNGK